MYRNIGVDIGGVIIDRVADDTDTSFFSDNYLNTPAVQDAFKVLALLKIHRDVSNVFLVSKCGERVQKKSLEWLKHNNFYNFTGLRESDVRFCRKRSEKTGICKDLEIDTFIDDRLEVLGYMQDDVPNRFLFRPDRKEVEKFKQYLNGVVVFHEWEDIIKHIVQSGGSSGR